GSTAAWWSVAPSSAWLIRRRFFFLSLQCHLVDRQTNLRWQHALGYTLGQLAQLGVVAKLAGFVLMQYAFVLQALDEVAEQALVEEFWRIEAMQDRQPLSHHRTQRFQLLGGEAVLAAVEQQ